MHSTVTNLFLYRLYGIKQFLNTEIMKPISTLKKSLLNTKRQYIYTYSRIAIPVMNFSSKTCK